MYPEDKGILAQPKKPGPITRVAISTSGIAQPPTDPDTDGRRQYSATAGDSFAYHPAAKGIAAPRQAGKMPLSTGERISESIGAVAQGSDAVGRPEVKQAGERGVSQNSGIAALPSRRVITAESTMGAQVNPLTRIGGIAGTTDMASVNDILARENKTRAEMIAMQNPNAGKVGILQSDESAKIERDNAEKTARWGAQDMASSLKGKGRAGSAIAQVMAAGINGQSNLAAERMRQETATASGVPTGRQREAVNPLVDELNRTKVQAGQLENQQSQRLGQLQQQLISEANPEKQAQISEQIRTISGKGRTDSPERLTLPQVRSNFEINAARKAVSALTPEEIKRKTANYTATGRENPEYDPTLAKAVSLAGRRRYGADDEFDQRQQQEQALQPAGNDGDVTTRFRADQAMQGHKTGQMTDQGLEVFDASGRLIGHYR